MYAKSTKILAGVTARLMCQQCRLTAVNAAAQPRNINQRHGRIEVGDIAYFQKAITKRDVQIFADISGDHNPLHLDEEYAKTTAFGRPIVHGALTFGLLSGVLGGTLPGHGGIFLNYTLKHPAPLYVGEEVKAEVEVKEISGNRLRLKMTCTETTSGKVVAIGECKVIAPAHRC